MNRRLIQLRSGPPSATLLRRIGGARPGTLALLVEVWGADDPRQRSAIEQRLAAGMASMFERRDGSLTARLRVALIAGDRWLRRVIQQEAAAEPPAAGRPRLLGAGASLLFVGEEEAFLAQAGPAVAYRLDLATATSGDGIVSGPDGPGLARHPAVSPWLRRGIEALSDDALWPPLGMGRAEQLEVHFGHWAFPPGSAAILAPSTAADLLSRDIVRQLLLSDPAGLQRRLDELLPPELPLVCLAQPHPPRLSPEPRDVTAAGGLPVASPARPVAGDGTAHMAYDDDGGAPEDVAGDGDDAPDWQRDGDDDALDAATEELASRPAERWVRWIGPPDPSTPAQDLERTTRFDAIAFDTGLLETGTVDGAGPESGYLTSGRTHSTDSAGAPERDAAGQDSPPDPAIRPPRATSPQAANRPPLLAPSGAIGPRLARLAARVLLGLLPRRGAEQGEEGYALERARLGAALALALPTAALLLTVLMRLRSLGGAGEVDPLGITAPAATTADAAGVLRLTDLRPLTNLDGEAGDSRQLLVNGNTAYVLNRALQRVDWVNLETAEVRPALQRGQAVGQAPPVGDIEGLALLPPPNDGPDAVKPAEVVALDAADRLWWLRPALVEPLERPAEPAWTAVDQLAGFDGSLYAVDRTVGQIYRYEAIGGDFPRYRVAGETWLTTPESLENSAEMQIDGAIYLRLVDGGLRKFVGGAAAPFAMSGLPPGESTPVLTALGMGSGQAILAADRDGGRILVLGPDGALRATYLRPTQPLEGNPDGRFSGISGLVWDGATGRLFILEGRSLLVASLPALP